MTTHTQSYIHIILYGVRHVIIFTLGAHDQNSLEIAGEFCLNGPQNISVLLKFIYFLNVHKRDQSKEKVRY